MTIAELQRAINSKEKLYKIHEQERATHNYILADLIGRSIARLYSSSAQMPPIGEVYPTLFDTKELEEKRQEKQAELSAIRFKQFANTFNAKFKGVQKDK